MTSPVMCLGPCTPPPAPAALLGCACARSMPRQEHPALRPANDHRVCPALQGLQFRCREDMPDSQEHLPCRRRPPALRAVARVRTVAGGQLVRLRGQLVRLEERQEVRRVRRGAQLLPAVQSMSSRDAAQNPLHACGRGSQAAGWHSRISCPGTLCLPTTTYNLPGKLHP